MKHLVASSIAAPSVPCFSPQSLLSLLYLSGTLHSKNLVYGKACNDQHFFTSATTARTSQMWFLYAFSYRKACDIREAEFSRRPVKDDYSDSPLTFFSPVLNVFVAKFASGCFSHQT